jgi:hypothetical protein
MNRLGIPQERIATHLGLDQKTIHSHLGKKAKLPFSLNGKQKGTGYFNKNLQEMFQEI